MSVTCAPMVTIFYVFAGENVIGNGEYLLGKGNGRIGSVVFNKLVDIADVILVGLYDGGEVEGIGLCGRVSFGDAEIIKIEVNFLGAVAGGGIGCIVYFETDTLRAGEAVFCVTVGGGFGIGGFRRKSCRCRIRSRLRGLQCDTRSYP